MFSAGRSPASLLLICVPPRPKAAWLLLRSVVPYRSLFFLLLPLCASTLTWPLSPATLSLYKFALSWKPFSPSAKSFSDRLFWRPGIRFSGTLFFFPPWSYYRPQFFGCVSLTVFLDALYFPTNHTLPVIWVAGSLFVPPCCTPVFLPLRSGPFFWGALLFRHPPACCPPIFAPLVRSVPGGPPFLTLFCAAWLTALGELTLFSPASLFVHFLHIRGLRSSRHLGVGTQAPRVLPPPSWDLSAIGN